MDVWAAAVLSFELMRTPGGEEDKDGVALFGSKMEVSSLSIQRLHVSLCHRNFYRSYIVQLQLFNQLVIRSSSHHLRPISLRSELYDTDAVKEKTAGTTLVMPLHAVKSAHVRAILDAALVTDAEERIGLEKVRDLSSRHFCSRAYICSGLMLNWYSGDEATEARTR
jgi:hypothetical protein